MFSEKTSKEMFHVGDFYSVCFSCWRFLFKTCMTLNPLDFELSLRPLQQEYLFLAQALAQDFPLAQNKDHYLRLDGKLKKRKSGRYGKINLECMVNLVSPFPFSLEPLSFWHETDGLPGFKL